VENLFLETTMIDIENLLKESNHLDEIEVDSIDKLIFDLQSIKDKFRRGKGKDYYRKEKAKIQGAISALRFIKRKTERRKEKALSEKITI
jgi:hypothetical protein